MLGLTLREEFRGKRLKGTAIELSNDQHTGATQIRRQQLTQLGIVINQQDFFGV